MAIHTNMPAIQLLVLNLRMALVLKNIHGGYLCDIESPHDAHVFCCITFSRSKADFPEFAVCDDTKVGINWGVVRSLFLRS